MNGLLLLGKGHEVEAGVGEMELANQEAVDCSFPVVHGGDDDGNRWVRFPDGGELQETSSIAL